MTADFKKLANTKASEFDYPPPLPEGHYLFAVHKTELREIKGRDDEDIDVLDVHCKAMRPIEGVDAGELKAYGDLDDRAVRKIGFWMTEGSVAKFTKGFCEETLKMDLGNRALGQLIEDIRGQRFSGEIKHELDKKTRQQTYANIVSYAALED